MSMGQLLLTMLIALFVFGPSKLPMLAKHLGQLMSKIGRYKRQAHTFWYAQLNEHQLQENKRRAFEGDATYQQKITNENKK